MQQQLQQVSKGADEIIIEAPRDVQQQHLANNNGQETVEAPRDVQQQQQELATNGEQEIPQQHNGNAAVASIIQVSL